jgi:hypothetical protein
MATRQLVKMKPPLTPLVCQVCKKNVTTIKEFENELRRGHWFDGDKLSKFLWELDEGRVCEEKTKERVEFT